MKYIPYRLYCRVDKVPLDREDTYTHESSNRRNCNCHKHLNNIDNECVIHCFRCGLHGFKKNKYHKNQGCHLEMESDALHYQDRDTQVSPVHTWPASPVYGGDHNFFSRTWGRFKQMLDNDIEGLYQLTAIHVLQLNGTTNIRAPRGSLANNMLQIQSEYMMAKLILISKKGETNLDQAFLELSEYQLYVNNSLDNPEAPSLQLHALNTLHSFCRKLSDKWHLYSVHEQIKSLFYQGGHHEFVAASALYSDHHLT